LGDIFALMFVRARYKEAVEPFLFEPFTLSRDTLRALGRVGFHIE
jgi:hypothetical protein